MAKVGKEESGENFHAEIYPQAGETRSLSPCHSGKERGTFLVVTDDCIFMGAPNISGPSFCLFGTINNYSPFHVAYFLGKIILFNELKGGEKNGKKENDGT